MRVIFLLVTIGIYLGLTGNAQGENSRIVKGNCEELSCEALWQTLQTKFSKKTTEYLSECSLDNTLSLFVYASESQSKRVYLSCWESQLENGERNGQFLGSLPFPGYEEQFGVKITSNDPNIQKRLEENSEQVKQISFECATRGGDINILVSDEQKVSLQCYFSVGVVLVDLDGDWVSDGENSRGTMIDFTEEIKN